MFVLKMCETRSVFFRATKAQNGNKSATALKGLITIDEGGDLEKSCRRQIHRVIF